MIALSEKQQPLRVLARRNGIYEQPILAYTIDFRFEDNPTNDLPKLLRLDAKWIAQHPLDDLYIVYINGDIRATHATWYEIVQLIHYGVLPPEPYALPTHDGTAWWEWIVALDANGKCIKAPKRPRCGEPTPEQVDESLRQEQVLHEQCALVA